jgi:hypothetical protein
MATGTSQDERRVVARRILAALCAHYPKRYIAPIESKAAAGSPEPVLTAAAAVEGAGVSVCGEVKAAPTNL